VPLCAAADIGIRSLAVEQIVVVLIKSMAHRYRINKSRIAAAHENIVVFAPT